MIKLEPRDISFLSVISFPTYIPSPYQTRQSLRAKYNMDFEPLKDFIGWVCFPWCSIMQTAKEVALKKGDEPVFIKPVVKNSMEDRAKEDAPTAWALTSYSRFFEEIESNEQAGEWRRPVMCFGFCSSCGWFNFALRDGEASWQGDYCGGNGMHLFFVLMQVEFRPSIAWY